MPGRRAFSFCQLIKVSLLTYICVIIYLRVLRFLGRLFFNVISFRILSGVCIVAITKNICEYINITWGFVSLINGVSNFCNWNKICVWCCWQQIWRLINYNYKCKNLIFFYCVELVNGGGWILGLSYLKIFRIYKLVFYLADFTMKETAFL